MTRILEIRIKFKDGVSDKTLLTLGEGIQENFPSELEYYDDRETDNEVVEIEDITFEIKAL